MTFDKQPVYPDGLNKEDFFVRLELNCSGKVVLCTGDTSATYKLSDISLEYDATFDESYVTTIGEMHRWNKWIIDSGNQSNINPLSNTV